MDSNRLPGCAVIVLSQGKPVYTSGFGFLDTESRTPFSTSTLCPTASLNKTINGIATLRLIEMGKVKFDEPVIPLLRRQGQLSSKVTFSDPRIERITVADLLRHESGFSDKTTLFPTLQLQAELGINSSPSLNRLVEHALTFPLERAPSTTFKYLNINFQLLDLVISGSVGKSYGQAVQELVFSPLGITDAKLFSSNPAARLKNEARCYDLPNRTGKSCLIENRGQTVPYSYGGIDYGPLNIWCLSADGIAKLLTALPGLDTRGGLLKSDGKRALFSLPNHDLGKDVAGNPANWYYSCGVWVNWTGAIGNSNVFFAHSGNQSGAFAGFKGSWNGTTIVVIGNGNDERYDMADRLLATISNVLN